MAEVLDLMYDDLLIYFQVSGTFDEHNGFPKLDRLRICFENDLIAKTSNFKKVTFL